MRLGLGFLAGVALMLGLIELAWVTDRRARRAGEAWWL